MSGSRDPERLPTPNWTPGRSGRAPTGIVVHTTEGTFAGAAAWFARRDSGVSAHWLVGLDGRVAQFVDEADTAHHAGRTLRPTAALAAKAKDLNPLTIGIEFEDGGDPLGVARPDAQYEAGARLIAEASARWDIPLDRDHVIGHREVFAAKDCPGNLDVDRLIARAGELRATPGGPFLACLVPARNAAEDLRGLLDTANALEASVIALDDGSTDATPALLESSDRVVRLLRNPPREGYAGWDDGANRRRLLEAATSIAPEWILFLDTDERIDADDAAALLSFLRTDGLPGLAYGLELYRQWGGRVVRRPTNVFRVFAPVAGQELPPGRLHFNPVPTDIPRRAWIRTSIRARHLDSPERIELRRRKYREADPGGSDAGATGALLAAPPAEQLVDWGPRPASLPALGASWSTSARGGATDDGPAGPALVVLTPARNCAADLPGLLNTAELLGAPVVALDDGSTDETAEVLERSPQVVRVLRNPHRESYAGWDDGANRQRLLDAAGEIGAEWVLYLDADERLDAEDAAALRRFIATDADPACAYGFRVHRMVGDGDRWDRAGLWAYRLFAPEPGQRLPDRRLHLVPVPTSIPRARWLRTTVRIQHLAGRDAARRRARLRKYEEADPHRTWQGDYSELLAEGVPRPWRARPAGLPVLADASGEAEAIAPEHLAAAPVLSAIVIATDDEATIEASLRALLDQECPLPFEVIVVVSGSPATAAVVRERLGERVTLIELPHRVMPGRARNVGLEAARGEYVSFPGSHVTVAPGSLAARVLAHEAGWAMVTGSVVNGNTSPAGWASYFLDHSSALPGRPSGELHGAPAHCSYVREFLVAAGGFPEDVRAGEDTVVNQRLWRQGHGAFREAAIALEHRSPSTTTRGLVRHHFVRGRAFGRILSADGRRGRRAALAILWAYPRRRLDSTDARVADWGGADLQRAYARVRPRVMAGIAAAWAGALLEVTRP